MKTTTLMFVSVLVSLSAAACGVPVAGNGPEAPMCTPRSGTYSAHYVERAGGTCGPMADTTFGIDPSQPDVAPSCTGRAIYSPDKCDETFDLTCPTGNSNQTLRNVGWTEWAPDASSGKSTFDYIYATDGNVTCSSTYDISYTRL